MFIFYVLFVTPVFRSDQQLLSTQMFLCQMTELCEQSFVPKAHSLLLILMNYCMKFCDSSFDPDYILKRVFKYM